MSLTLFFYIVFSYFEEQEHTFEGITVNELIAEAMCTDLKFKTLTFPYRQYIISHNLLCTRPNAIHSLHPKHLIALL